MTLRDTLLLFKEAARKWSADRASQMGAALAYYALFSVAPLLMMAIIIAGLVYGEEAARGELIERLRAQFGAEPSLAVQNLLVQVSKPAATRWATAVSVATLLLGALGIFVHLRTALHAIWKVPPAAGSSILGLLKGYLFALGMVLCVGVLLLAALTASTTLAAFIHRLGDAMPGGTLIWRPADFLLSLALVTLLFAVTFKFLSDGAITWKEGFAGAAVSSLLFTAGKMVIGYYLVYSSTASAYGAAGSLVLFLVWVYYSAQIFIFGAEVIQAKRETHG